MHHSLIPRIAALLGKAILVASALLAFITCLLVARQNARACAAAPRAGEHVGIANETALIIWDDQAKVQHFIRRATFDTKADDFGFLVPTPTRPDLGEAHDYTFKMLEKITAPAEKTSLVIMRPGEAGAAAPQMPPDGVEIVESKRVGDFDAVVLKADDPGAIDGWLRKHGYASDAALAAWLKGYVSRHWYLTAFKIAKEAKQGVRATASAVRMSFASEKPFFPYREPASQGQHLPSRRLLRVYLVANQRMMGTIGDGGTGWPASTVWSGAMPKAELEFLAFAMRIHENVKGDGWWLTEFEDWSSPRPGTDDVVFTASGDSSIVTRPPIVHHLVHVEEDRKIIIPDWVFVAALVFAALSVVILGAVFLSRRSSNKRT